MRFFTSMKLGGILVFALAFFSLVVSGDPTNANVRCENIYKDFSDCFLELGERMNNYQENVTSEKGVAAVCSHWEAFHTCALTALADCQGEVSSIWETLRQDSKKMRFQGSLFDLCSPSSSPRMRSHFAPLSLTSIVVLVVTEPIWSFG